MLPPPVEKIRPFTKSALLHLFFQLKCVYITGVFSVFKRPGVAGSVLQTLPLLIKSLSHPFPPDLQNITTPKPLELGS